MAAHRRVDQHDMPAGKRAGLDDSASAHRQHSEFLNPLMRLFCELEPIWILLYLKYLVCVHLCKSTKLMLQLWISGYDFNISRYAYHITVYYFQINYPARGEILYF